MEGIEDGTDGIGLDSSRYLEDIIDQIRDDICLDSEDEHSTDSEDSDKGIRSDESDLENVGDEDEDDCEDGLPIDTSNALSAMDLLEEEFEREVVANGVYPPFGLVIITCKAYILLSWPLD
jgi:hypothetical protein